MENWDFRYKKTGAPAALDNAPTVDGGADDPTNVAKGTAGAFSVGDKYGVDTAVDLMIFAEGGNPTCILYVWSKAAGSGSAGKWILFKDAITPTPTAPVSVKVPPHAKLFLRVSVNAAATAIYAGIMPT